jgi:hypothetical protein
VAISEEEKALRKMAVEVPGPLGGVLRSVLNLVDSARAEAKEMVSRHQQKEPPLDVRAIVDACRIEPNDAGTKGTRVEFGYEAVYSAVGELVSRLTILRAEVEREQRGCRALAEEAHALSVKATELEHERDASRVKVDELREAIRNAYAREMPDLGSAVLVTKDSWQRLLTLAEPSTPSREETAWLIERKGIGLCYRKDGTSNDSWVTFIDPNAWRFPTKQAAEKIINERHLYTCFAAEHGWVSPSRRETERGQCKRCGGFWLVCTGLQSKAACTRIAKQRGTPECAVPCPDCAPAKVEDTKSCPTCNGTKSVSHYTGRGGSCATTMIPCPTCVKVDFGLPRPLPAKDGG